MDDPKGIEALISFNNFFDHANGVGFKKFFLGLYILSKVSSITVISDNVGLIFIRINLLDIEEIGAIFNHVEDLDLRGEEIFVYFSLHSFHIDDFDGDVLV